MEGDDWDLAAVVRSCCCSRAKSVAIEGGEKKVEIFAEFSRGFLEKRTNLEGLEELCSPFLFKQKKRAADADVAASRKVQSKRSKKQMKKVVCQVPADGVSLDMWSWRKYGQKPIKGSPFPRGYYRCSSFRGCPARKQVERNRTDPTQLIITYTSDHNHPMPNRHTLSSASTSDGKTKEEDLGQSSPATSASVDGGDGGDEKEDDGVLMVEDIEVIGEGELVFLSDDASVETTLVTGVASFSDDRLFSSRWLENSSSSNATAAAC